MTQPKSFAQKAIARAAGLDHVVEGQVVDAQPDVMMSHDNTAAIMQIWREFGQDRVVAPQKMAITLDHAVPAPTTRHALNHAEIREFVARQGIRHFYDIGRGICHEVWSEESIVLPGQMLLGSDSHTPHFGWLGAFGAGIGRSEMAVLWATGELWLRVPESIRVTLTGELPMGVTAKDFALRLIGDHGADGGLYASIEFAGDGIAVLPLEQRMVLPNMMAEFGAKNAYIAADKKTVDYLAVRRVRREWILAESGDVPLAAAATVLDMTQFDAQKFEPQIADMRAQIAARALTPDEGVPYLADYIYSAAELEPYVACPHTVDNVVPVSALAGTRVQQAFVGTCTNGRLSDLAAAAAAVAGRHVAAGTRLLIVPASKQVLTEAMRLGYIQTLLDAGAVLGVPGCGPCMGNHMGIPAPNEVTISSANRNFQGRMGTRDADTFLANAAVVAASAIAGEIVDPRAV